MTKEEIYSKFESTSLSEFSQRFARDVLDEFFDSNVCIPKGEGIEVLVGTEWEYAQHWRIKPSVPVYEWLWYDYEYGKPRMSLEWLTKEEANMYNWNKRVEETKRLRK